MILFVIRIDECVDKYIMITNITKGVNLTQLKKQRRSIMNITKLPNTVFVTVKRKTGVFKSVPIWNKVMMNLLGDTSDMKNLIKELEEVKANVNSDMNKRGLALKDVDILIEIKE